jgi:hypothetical protein
MARVPAGDANLLDVPHNSGKFSKFDQYAKTSCGGA